MKNLNILILLLFFTVNAFGFKDVSYNILKKDEQKIELKRLPKTDYSQEIIKILEDFDPVICVEAIFYVDKEYNLTREEMLTNVMAVSTLSGIEYYSQTERRIKTFVKNAYITDYNNNIIPDAVVRNVDDLPSVTAVVMDNRFGKLHYNIDYFNSDETFGMVMSNISTLTYLFVPLVSSGNVRLMYQIIPTQDGFIFYGLSMTRTKTPGFLENKLSDALYNRMVAVIDWFLSSID